MKKENSIVIVPEAGRMAEASRLISWMQVQKLLNRLPFGIAPCRNTREAKLYAAVMLAVLSVAVLPLAIIALTIYLSTKNK